jgi:Reverse transcriptase (RNA-dependent DNA polymerase)
LIPKSVREALDIDSETGTTFWTDAIRKEMSVILPAMKILDRDAKPPIGYQEVPCHMVFDVKIDFTRKARYVGGGHVTKPPTTQTYASVVSRDSVRIAFLYASLNDLKVMSADVQGAYLNAPYKEKVYTRCGPEFGPENIGKIAVVVKALYGLKTSAFAWREHLSHTLESSLEFSHCLADNDVWMRPATKADGTEYYQYILVHTDDLLVVAEKPIEILNLLDQHYVLKPGSIGEPKRYLGAEVGLYHLPNNPERPVWYMSSEKYIKEAIRNVKQWLDVRGKKLKGKAPSVLPSGYRPELDVSTYCNEEDGNYFQQQIGVLR